MRFPLTLARRLLCAALLVLSWPLAAVELPKGILTLDARAAPPLVLKNMDGDSWDIANARGHWVFVHFWAVGVAPADGRCQLSRRCSHSSTRSSWRLC